MADRVEEHMGTRSHAGQARVDRRARSRRLRDAHIADADVDVELLRVVWVGPPRRNPTRDVLAELDETLDQLGTCGA